MMSRLPATSGHSGGVAADLVASGGLGVAPPRAFAKHCRVLPEVFDDCSSVCRRLSHRERAIIREVNEIAFALNFLETDGLAEFESCKKVGYSMLSIDLTPLALRNFHTVLFGFRPPSVADEAALAIGGYSLSSDDPTPGSLTVFQSSRVTRPQDASKSSLPCVTADCF